MSRIGSQPITLPEAVSVAINGQDITVKGPKGELSRVIDGDIAVAQNENQLVFTRKSNSKTAKQKWGLFRSLVNNMVQGVNSGFTKTLEINGVGYKAAVKNKFLTLNLGYSHEIKFEIPATVEVKCPKPTVVELSSFDNEALGQAAAVIRSLRKPEPYKGKGVKYSDEYIFRKEGKKK